MKTIQYADREFLDKIQNLKICINKKTYEIRSFGEIIHLDSINSSKMNVRILDAGGKILTIDWFVYFDFDEIIKMEKPIYMATHGKYSIMSIIEKSSFLEDWVIAESVGKLSIAL